MTELYLYNNKLWVFREQSRLDEHMWFLANEFRQKNKSFSGKHSYVYVEKYKVITIQAPIVKLL